jgi:anaerobic nitric oxide reductase flavorubredoxin
MVRSGDTSHDDRNDVINEAFISKAVLLGSPAINRGILSAVSGLLEEIRGLGFSGDKRHVFRYVWMEQ